MAGGHRPVDVVEAHGGTVVHGQRPLAAQLVQAPTLARLLGVKGRSELAGFKMAQTLTAVVHGLAVEHERPPVLIQLDVLACQHGDQSAHHIQGGRRTAGDVDGLYAQRGKTLVDPHTARGVGGRRGNAAEGGAGAVSHNCSGPGQNLAGYLQHGPAAYGAVNAVVRRGDGAFHHAEKPVGIAYGRVQGFFRRLAGGGHDGFLVIQGDDVKDEFVEKRLIGAQYGFRTGRTLRVVQIDHGRTFGRDQRLGHTRGKGRAHAHGHCHRGTELQKVTAADPAFRKTFFDPIPARSDGNSHFFLLTLTIHRTNLTQENSRTRFSPACPRPARSFAPGLPTICFNRSDSAGQRKAEFYPAPPDPRPGPTVWLPPQRSQKLL